MNDDIFEPFERLIEIEIRDETVRVPENNSLLRCFQFLNMETVSNGDFCWNGDCANCQVWLENTENEKPALACRTKVKSGMRILRMSEEIKITKNEKSIVKSAYSLTFHYSLFTIHYPHSLSTKFSISELSRQLRSTTP